jgi:hypothetical protein
MTRIKSYLSYSQYFLFRKSRAEYKKVYIDGIKLNNKYLDFGKKISDGLEHRRKKTKDIDVIKARKLIKPTKEREKEINVMFGDVPLKGVLDGYENKGIEEYKTGTEKWTQKRVDDSEQLTIYAILVSERLKIPVENIPITLRWLPTFKDTNEELHLTGEIIEFKTQRTKIDIIRFYPKIKKTWVEIEEFIDNLIKTT